MKFFSKKTNSGAQHPHLDKYSRVNPARHWSWIVISFGVLTVVVITLSLIMYFKINNGTFFDTIEPVDASVKTIDREKLDSVVDFFEKKRAAFDTEKTSPAVSIDPGV